MPEIPLDPDHIRHQWCLVLAAEVHVCFPTSHIHVQCTVYIWWVSRKQLFMLITMKHAWLRMLYILQNLKYKIRRPLLYSFSGVQPWMFVHSGKIIFRYTEVCWSLITAQAHRRHVSCQSSAHMVWKWMLGCVTEGCVHQTEWWWSLAVVITDSLLMWICHAAVALGVGYNVIILGLCFVKAGG